MEILYQDESIIVCIKPAGVVCENAPCANVPAIIKEQTGFDTYTVHRLDRETTGIMVYAKTKEAAAALSKQIQNNDFRKCYYAVVNGKPQESCGELTDYLFRDKAKNKSFVVKRERKGVKKAVLSYKLIETSNELSLLDIALNTGRTHQIRVQFSSRNLPLYGDRKYGGKGEKLALIAYSLEFLHPLTGKLMSFEIKPENEYPWNIFLF